MKKFLKWTGLSIGILFLLLLILPFLFKGKIIEAVKKAANDNLNAKVQFEDVSLSLIRNFPNLRVSIENITVDNVAPFDSVRLAQIKNFNVVVDIKSVFGDEIQVKRIALVEPIFDVRVKKDGTANYDIAKPDTVAATPEAPSEGGAFKLNLKEYSIENGMLSYNDQSMPMLLKLEGLNHNGSGNMADDVIDLKTITHADKGTFWFDGITYVHEARTDINADLNMDMKNMKFTIGGNEIKLNELLLGAEGWVSMPAENIDMDISFKALKTDFKNLLSMVPMEFAKDVSGVDATGNMALDGYVRGTYNDTSMPGIGLNILVENGRFKYPDLPKSVDNIQVKAAIVADMNVMDNTTVDVEKFHLEMAQNPVDMRLKLRTPESDPDIDFAIKAFVNLDNIREFIPLKQEDQVHGTINADVALKGRKSSVDQGRYDEFNAQGAIDIKNVFFKGDSVPYDMNVNAATFNFTPAFVDLSAFNATIGKSDISANGKITNYLSYALHDSLLVGTFNLNSNSLDLNEFMSSSTPAAAPAEQTAQTPAPADTSAMAPIELPGNVDFTLNAAIGKILYDKNEITNVKGGIVLREKIAYLKGLTMNVLDGVVGMNGNYNAQNLALPKMDFAFDIQGMDINKAATQFTTIDKLAPVAKACNGKFTTKLSMRSDLDKHMMPINPTVNGLGNLQTKNVVVKDFAPIVKLAEKINYDKLKQPLTVNDVNLTFKIKDGVVNVDPFVVKLDGIPCKIHGYTTLDQVIDYNVDMDIPMDRFPSNIVNQAGSFIGDLNKKLGSNLSIGKSVNVIARITGTVKDPKVGVTSKALGEDALQSLKDQAVTAIKQEVVQQATALKNEALEKAKTEKERLVAEAKVQAEKAKQQARVLAQQGKEEAYKLAKQTEDSAKNPLEKMAKKVAADKIRKEADDKYNKAVAKADQEADKLVVDASARGDKMISDANAAGDQTIKKVN